MTDADMEDKNLPFDPFSGPEIERVVHTTRSQEEIWTACRLGGKNANRAYNESISLKLKGELDFKAFEKAVQKLVDRHESLRAVFSTDGRFMTIFRHLETILNFIDISDLDASKKEVALSACLKEDANHVFDLVKGPLLKSGLLKINDGEYLLILTAHHIICDGWSLGIMLQELGTIYTAYVENKELSLPTSESFSSFADEQLELNKSEAYLEIEKFWLGQYENSVPLVDLPTDAPRPALRTFKSERLDFEMDSHLLESLKKTGVQAGCSLVSSLLAGFEIFLHRLTGKEDVIVGLPSAGQSAAGRIQLVGHCVNLLPLRSKLEPSTTFNSYLKQRKSELFDAYENQQLSFGHLLQRLSLARDASRVPLVPVVFNIDLGMTDGVDFSGLTFELISNPREYETFEIFLNASGTADGLVFEWSYNSALFKPETIEEMMASFESLLRKLTETPNEAISQIKAADYSAAYEALNSTSQDYPSQSLPELIDTQAKATPDNIAVVFGEKEISYEELRLKVNQLANYLSENGLEQGNLVGFSLPRCAEIPIFLLAIMQCGAAFIPLDPKYPASRLEFMLEDSGAKILLTTKELSNSFSAKKKVLLVEDIMSAAQNCSTDPIKLKVDNDEMAYQIYTSGSTGKPKGIRATQKNLVNFLYGMLNGPGLEETDKLLSVTSISFDPVFLELFLPLLKGATIIMADEETARDGRLLLDFLQNEDISILQATPTTWQMLLDSGWGKHISLKALCGGEALSIGLANQLLERCSELWNIYGPTETTVWSIIKKIEKDDYPITIGKPISNMQLYLIDGNDNLVAPGMVGEICIAGDGMTLGYWNREDLNAEKFIENPFSAEYKTLYKSGDLGKLTSNGEIQCLGRVDQQVKIRGHRIEPGEIEQTLISLDGILSAAVVAKSDKLVAYIVSSNEKGSKDDMFIEWRSCLNDELPAHMVPQEFILLESLPKTPNGKIDRKALMEPTAAKQKSEEATAPRTENEQLIASIWQECLNLKAIDISSNFFELGGHSLIAVKVMTLIEKKTGKRLPLSALFEYSTIEKLATLLETDTKITANDSLVPIKPNGKKPPLYIVHGAGLNVLIFNNLANRLDDDQPVFGLQAQGLKDKNNKLKTIEEIAAKYVECIVQANPNGPYSLAGYSFGGYIAYEMARQLKKQGKKVTMLTILDTYAEPHYYHSSYLRKKIATLGYHTQRLSVLIKDMTGSWSAFKFHLNRKKENLLDRFSRAKREEETRISESQGHFKVDKSVLKIMGKYQLIPDDIQIDLLRAEEAIYYLHDPEHLGWGDIALEGVKVHDVPGNHLNIFLEPNDKITGLKLQRILDLNNS